MESGRSKIINDPEDIEEFTAGFLQAVHLPAKTQSRLRRLIPPLLRLLSYRSMLIVPLISGDKVIGTLDMGRGEPFTVEDAKRLETIAAQLTTAIQHKQTEEALYAISSRQEALLAAIPDIVMEVNNERVYTWANPAGVELAIQCTNNSQ
jgi:GAF domain-containing protein